MLPTYQQYVTCTTRGDKTKKTYGNVKNEARHSSKKSGK